MRKLITLMSFAFASRGYTQLDNNATQKARTELRLAIREAQRKLTEGLRNDRKIYATNAVEATQGIENLIDQYVEQGEVISDNEGAIRADLDDLMERHEGAVWTESYAPTPIAQLLDLGPKKFLVTGYTLPGASKGGVFTSTVMAAYSIQGNRAHLKSKIDTDFNGFAPTIYPINSPFPTSAYYLVFGPKYGFNGTLIRTRIYSFDGQSWQVVWKPNDLINAEIEVAGDSVTIVYRDVHRYYELRTPPFTRKDVYKVAASGVSLLSSDLQNE